MSPALPFEQERLDQEAAAAFESAKAALRKKLATRLARARRDKQEAIDKSYRRWKREQSHRDKHSRDHLAATCGINFYSGSSGWTRCHTCNRPLVYTDSQTAMTRSRECVPAAPAPLGSGQN